MTANPVLFTGSAGMSLRHACPPWGAQGRTGLSSACVTANPVLFTGSTTGHACAPWMQLACPRGPARLSLREKVGVPLAVQDRDCVYMAWACDCQQEEILQQVAGKHLGGRVLLRLDAKVWWLPLTSLSWKEGDGKGND